MADFRIRIAVENPSRGPGGRFAKGYNNDFRGALAASNARMARELQAEVVENMKSGIMRRNVSTGRLVAVTGDPRNISWSDAHYSVGDMDWLDRGIAKYWRQIEGGFAGHVGRQITGFWGANIGRINGGTTYAAPPWYRHSARRSDMFLPATGFRQEGRFARYGADAEEEGRRGAPNFARTTTIKNPIEAHNDYRDAKRAFDPGARSLQEVNQILQGLSHQAWMGRMERQGRFFAR